VLVGALPQGLLSMDSCLVFLSCQSEECRAKATEEEPWFGTAYGSEVGRTQKLVLAMHR
jgi:hypothetical protein